MIQWIPSITAWIAAMITGGVTLYQMVKNQKREINKELNQQRLAFYPDVQTFMVGVYGKTWLEAMKEEGRLQNMMNISKKMIFWASNDTLKIWTAIVNEGQRGKIDSQAVLATHWAKLDIAMRKDLGYGAGIKPEELFPILFSPKSVDLIHEQLKNNKK